MKVTHWSWDLYFLLPRGLRAPTCTWRKTSRLHSPATSVDFEGCGNLRTGAGALNLERLVEATEALTDGILIICYSKIRIWKRTRVILS